MKVEITETDKIMLHELILKKLNKLMATATKYGADKVQAKISAYNDLLKRLEGVR